MTRRLMLALVVLAYMAGPVWAQSTENAYAEGEVLVRYHASADAPASTVAGFPGVRVGRTVRGVHLLRSDRMSTTELIKVMRADPSVDVVEPNYRYRRQQLVPDDPRYDELWGMARIGAPEAWTDQTGSRDVVVAVLDTGIDYTHEDLAANMWTSPGAAACTGLTTEQEGWVEDGVHGYDFAVDDDGADGPDPMDNEGHGTHVAGTIAAVGDNSVGVVGVNWRVSLIAVQLERPDGFFYSSDQLQAFEYLQALKEHCSVDIVAANASYGGEGSGSTLVRDAIEALGEAGIIFVAAAGNETSDNDVVPTHPANYDLANVVSVASIDTADQLSDFSNYGLETVHLAAPGSEILSTGLPWTATGLVKHDGTEYAATVFTYSPGIPNPLVAETYHCGLLLEPSDCPPEVAGAIALVERGEVNFSVKVENARTAGAVAVVIYNSVEGGEEPINGTLGSPGDWLPALGVPRSTGLVLRDLDAPTVTLSTEGGYVVRSGTSMATPHVTGALALIAAQFPGETVTQRVERLLAAVEPLPALQETTRTGGMLDLRRLFVDPSAQPPMRPGNFAAFQVAPDQVQLSWTDRSSYTTEFEVERATGIDPFVAVATLPASTTSLAQPGLDPQQTYRWRVRAVAPGGASAWSNIVQAQTSLVSGSVAQSSVGLDAWKLYPVFADAERTQVVAILDQLTADGDLYLRRGAEPTLDDYNCRSILGETSVDRCSVTNTGDNVWYVGVYGFEATDFRLTIWMTPRPVTGLDATAVAEGEIQLDWAHEDGDAGFRVQRSDNEGAFVQIAELAATSTSYVDEDLQPGQYVYRVIAFNEAGTSAQADIAVEVFETITITDPAGDTVESLMTDSGTVSFAATGGSGNFEATVLPSIDTGAVATLATDDTGWTFTAPAIGAYAGVYPVVVRDVVTGLERSIDVTVPLDVVTDHDTYRSGVDGVRVVVSGGSPGMSPAYSVDSPDGPVAFTLVESSAAEDDAASGNPARATLSVATSHTDATVAVEDSTRAGRSDPFDLIDTVVLSGHVEDRTGASVAGALLSAAAHPGPQSNPWVVASGADGAFTLALPDPTPAPYQLVASSPGHVDAAIEATLCLSGCVVVLDVADHTLQGTVGPMFPGEHAEVTLIYRNGAIEHDDLQRSVTAGGGGEAAFEFPLDVRVDYRRLQVEAPGYEPVVDDNNGAGWNPSGADITGVRIELVPTTPVIVGGTTGVSATSNAATYQASIGTEGRNTRVWFEYGTSSLQFASADTFLTAGVVAEVSRTVSGLACGTDYRFRVVAENDWAMRVEGETRVFTTLACAAGQLPPEPRSGGGVIGPVGLFGMVLLWLLAVRRRAIRASA